MSNFQEFVIKTERVFSIIREINEILALTNEPDKLADTALDALCQTLKIECCWIQTISDRKRQKLSLAAERGFSDGMRTEITAIDLKNSFAGETIGMGHKITIPDLNNDGAYGLDTFRSAGYRWLVAVPLMTYRAYGLLGAASKNKRLFDKDTTGLIMVIGGLIANALSKAHFSRDIRRRDTGPDTAVLKPDKAPAPADTGTTIAPMTPTADITPEKTAIAPLPDFPPTPLTKETQDVTVLKQTPPEKAHGKHTDPAFHSHMRQMEHFRKTHR